MKGLEVWNAVKEYLNLYHHQAVKENIDVETVEGMPIDVIEKELKALEIIKEKKVDTAVLRSTDSAEEYNMWAKYEQELSHEQYRALKEVFKNE